MCYQWGLHHLILGWYGCERDLVNFNWPEVIDSWIHLSGNGKTSWDDNLCVLHSLPPPQEGDKSLSLYLMLFNLPLGARTVPISLLACSYCWALQKSFSSHVLVCFGQSIASGLWDMRATDASSYEHVVCYRYINSVFAHTWWTTVDNIYRGWTTVLTTTTTTTTKN